MKFRGDFFEKRLPLFHPLAEALAWKLQRRLAPKFIKASVAKGYPRAEVEWVRRALHRNGMHRRECKQNWERCVAFIEGRHDKLLRMRGS